MARVIVVYESKYGNTKLVAETIVEGMKGPISDGELPQCRDFGRRIVAEIGTS